MPKIKQSLGRATRNAKHMKSRAKNPDIQTRDVSPTHQPYSELRLSVGNGTYEVCEPPTTISLPANIHTTDDKKCSHSIHL